jgi:hypothetical protein
MAKENQFTAVNPFLSLKYWTYLKYWERHFMDAHSVPVRAALLMWTLSVHTLSKVNPFAYNLTVQHVLYQDLEYVWHTLISKMIACRLFLICHSLVAEITHITKIVRCGMFSELSFGLFAIFDGIFAIIYMVYQGVLYLSRC